MKICKECKVNKELNEFYRNGKSYRGRCKKCHNSKFQPATGKPNAGRFKEGQKPVCGFKKNHLPWNKGKKMSAEHRRKLSKSHKGKAPRNNVLNSVGNITIV